MPISNIETAILALSRGEMIVVVDDERRENEGDLLIAADDITAEAVAFMMREARGLICIAMEGERLDRLDIPLMVAANTDSNKTAFTVSVDLIEGTTTGISAADRAATIQALSNSKAGPLDFSRPGHIFPLRSNDGGVRARRGHTEAAVELARLAGKTPAGVICEIANADGTMARRPQLEHFASRHKLVLVTIESLLAYLDEMEVSYQM